MSSHREAPGIAKDPVADNTDLYAFVSPDKPNTVTILANFIPLEYPPGGPNFFEFGDDVTYSIHISNDGRPDCRVEKKNGPSQIEPCSATIGTHHDPGDPLPLALRIRV